MARTAILAIKIISDATNAAKGLSDAAGGVSKFEKGMGKAASAAKGVITGLVAIGAVAFKEASELQQNAGAVEAVFGKQSEAVMGLADAAAQSVGLAKSEYAGLASVLGAQLKNLGVSQSDLVGTTDDLITTGADLAATFGGSTADAVDALTAAFRGETDPIEKYGISLKQADVNAELAAKGQSKLTGSAKKQAETQARLAIIMRQSADAQGQFGREADTAAGQQQRAAAATKNALADLGTVLLPVVSQLAQKLSEVATYVSQNAATFQTLAVVIGAVAAAIIAVNTALTIFKAVQTAMAVATKVATAAQWLWNVAMTANPIGLIIVGIAALIAGFVLLYQKSETFRNAVNALWAGMKIGIAAVITFFTNLGTKIAEIARSIAAWFVSAWNTVKAATAAVVNFIKSYLTAVATLAATVAGKIASAFRAGWNAVKAATAAVVNFIKSYLTAVATLAASVGRKIAAVFKAAWSAVKAGATAVGTAVRSVFTRIASTVSSIMSSIKSKVTSAFNAIKSAARSVGSAILAPFRALQGVINSVIGAVHRLVSALRNIKVPKLSFPKIPSAFTGTRSAQLSSGPTGAGLLRAGGDAGPLLGSAGGRVGAGGVVIQVNGALDPDAVARQIERILSGGQRRRGGVTMAQRAGATAAAV